jgi:hypothetical protein
MQRTLAWLLMLLFGLGPLTATLQASHESRLPACCRRHGSHHCAMADAMRAQLPASVPGRTPTFTAPLHCPMFPHGTAAPSASTVALAASSPAPPSPHTDRHTTISSALLVRDAARLNRSGRSPPRTVPL